MRFNMVEYKTNLTSFKYKMLEGKNYYFVGVALMGEGTRKVARCVSTMVQKIIQNSLVQLMNEAIQVLLEASQRPCTRRLVTLPLGVERGKERMRASLPGATRAIVFYAT